MNVDNYLLYIDAIIVATGIYKGGEIENEPDSVSIFKFMKEINNYRRNYKGEIT